MLKKKSTPPKIDLSIPRPPTPGELLAEAAQEERIAHRSPLQNEDGTWKPDPGGLERAAVAYNQSAQFLPPLQGALTMLQHVNDDSLGCPTCLRSGLLSAFVGRFAGQPGAGHPLWDRHYVPGLWANSIGKFPPVGARPGAFLDNSMLHLCVLVSEHDGQIPDDLTDVPTFAHTCAGVPGVVKSADAPFLAGLGLCVAGRGGTDGLAVDLPPEAMQAAAKNGALRIALLLAPRLDTLDDPTWGVFRALIGPEAWSRDTPHWEPLTGHTPPATAWGGYRTGQSSIDGVAEWLLGSGLKDSRTPPPAPKLTDAERLAALEARLAALMKEE